jgi:hypothetical protein
MSRNVLHVVPLLLVVIAASSVALAPLAVADPSMPVSSGQSADVVVDDLTAQGYNVQINWVSGFDTKPLSECWVTGINNPGSAPPSPGTFVTVYVDVACPNHDDDGGFGFGGGIG